MTAFSVVSTFGVACAGSGSGGVGEGVLGAETAIASPVACAGAKATGEGVGEGGAAGGGAAADELASPLVGAPECKKTCQVVEVEEAQREHFCLVFYVVMSYCV